MSGNGRSKSLRRAIENPAEIKIVRDRVIWIEQENCSAISRHLIKFVDCHWKVRYHYQDCGKHFSFMCKTLLSLLVNLLFNCRYQILSRKQVRASLSLVGVMRLWLQAKHIDQCIDLSVQDYCKWLQPRWNVVGQVAFVESATECVIMLARKDMTGLT